MCYILKGSSDSDICLSTVSLCVGFKKMATRSRYLLQMAFKGIRARAVCHQSSTLTSNQGRLQWKRQLRPLSCSHTLYTSDSPSTGSCYTFIMVYSSTSLHEAQAQSVTVVLQLHNLYWKSPGWNLDGVSVVIVVPLKTPANLPLSLFFSRPQRSVIQKSHLWRTETRPRGRESHPVWLGPIPQVIVTAQFDGANSWILKY